MESISYSNCNVMRILLLTTDTVMKQNAYNSILDFTSHLMKKLVLLKIKWCFNTVFYDLLQYTAGSNVCYITPAIHVWNFKHIMLLKQIYFFWMNFRRETINEKSVKSKLWILYGDVIKLLFCRSCSHSARIRPVPFELRR